jgi:Lytic transglycolase
LRPEYIEHEIATLVGQRVFGIALGYCGTKGPPRTFKSRKSVSDRGASAKRRSARGQRPPDRDRQTATGEIMDAGKMTAAHRTLPFGTQVTVVNRSNGRSVTVRINDRGPFVHGRVIDLSPAAGRAMRHRPAAGLVRT